MIWYSFPPDVSPSEFREAHFQVRIEVLGSGSKNSLSMSRILNWLTQSLFYSAPLILLAQISALGETDPFMNWRIMCIILGWKPSSGYTYFRVSVPERMAGRSPSFFPIPQESSLVYSSQRLIHPCLCVYAHACRLPIPGRLTDWQGSLSQWHHL